MIKIEEYSQLEKDLAYVFPKLVVRIIIKYLYFSCDCGEPEDWVCNLLEFCYNSIRNDTYGCEIRPPLNEKSKGNVGLFIYEDNKKLVNFFRRRPNYVDTVVDEPMCYRYPGPKMIRVDFSVCNERFIKYHTYWRNGRPSSIFW